MIGVLMLDTTFPRLKGDIGNPESFSSQTIYETVAGANVARIVSSQPADAKTIEAFIAAGQVLQRRGATVIGTSCGFLASVQQEIASGLGVPFLGSSLLLVPLLKTMFGAQARIGVLTFDQRKLTDIHFNGHLDESISITGLDPACHWAQCISTGENSVDQQQAKLDVLEVARRCIHQQPETEVLLFECTNLSPWKQEIRELTGLPAFDLVDALEWIHLTAGQRLDISSGK